MFGKQSFSYSKGLHAPNTRWIRQPLTCHPSGINQQIRYHLTFDPHRFIQKPLVPCAAKAARSMSINHRIHDPTSCCISRSDGSAIRQPISVNLCELLDSRINRPYPINAADHTRQTPDTRWISHNQRRYSRLSIQSRTLTTS